MVARVLHEPEEIYGGGRIFEMRDRIREEEEPWAIGGDCHGATT